MPDASSLLTAWSNFYVMTGSAAAALTGLMFVVITLMAGRDRMEGAQDGIATFSTPTIMHLAASLLVSAVLIAPWHSLAHPGLVVALLGLAGLGYVLRVMHRTRRLTVYRADLEDWAWYGILPALAYAPIAAGGLVLVFTRIAVPALFVVAGGVVLLIFISIRNAWDVVTYLAIVRR
jgi:hypothetical protein